MLPAAPSACLTLVKGGAWSKLAAPVQKTTMNPKISELLDRIRRIEDEIEAELKRRRAELHADFEDRRVQFERAVLEQQRRFKAGLLHYVFTAELRHAVTVPFIYPVIVPLLLLDLFVMAYQAVCFPLYGIERVRRRDYLVFDRAHLAYLNLLEKVNCAFCSYGTGLAAFVTEVIGRTEQYWCPIKHARRSLRAHPYYSRFLDFGDAEGYRRELKSLRAQLARMGAEPQPD
jgi:hypothetical protein